MATCQQLTPIRTKINLSECECRWAALVRGLQRLSRHLRGAVRARKKSVNDPQLRQSILSFRSTALAAS